jgi:Methyltransferase FkbM domain
MQGKQRRVPIVTLDGLIDAGKMPVPEFAKFDVQGFELEALQGATKLLSQTEVFILEVSLFRFWQNGMQPIFHEVVNFMTDHGYLVYDFPGFLRRPYDGALAQVDVCFVKQDSALNQSQRWS